MSEDEVGRIVQKVEETKVALEELLKVCGSLIAKREAHSADERRIAADREDLIRSATGLKTIAEQTKRKEEEVTRRERELAAREERLRAEEARFREEREKVDKKKKMVMEQALALKKLMEEEETRESGVAASQVLPPAVTQAAARDVGELKKEESDLDASLKLLQGDGSRTAPAETRAADKQDPPAVTALYSMAQQIIEELRAKGLVVSDADGLLSQAKAALDAGDTRAAEKNARDAEVRAKRIAAEHKQALELMAEAGRLIDEKRAKGADVSAYERGLSQLGMLMEVGTYKQAVESCREFLKEIQGAG